MRVLLLSWRLWAETRSGSEQRRIADVVGWEAMDGAVCGSRRGRKKRVGCFRPCFAGRSRDELGTRGSECKR